MPARGRRNNFFSRPDGRGSGFDLQRSVLALKARLKTMRTLVHLSDLHFGRIDHRLVRPLVELIQKMQPDVVAVSGDLTQRARNREFKEARAFLDSLTRPQIVVPGNHDVPLYNLFGRFIQRLGKFRRFITDDLEPFYTDQEIAVAGVNTARSMTVKQGRINREQIDRLHERLSLLPGALTKIIVAHHPFDLPEEYLEGALVDGARLAMDTLAECGADLFLSGHLHLSHTGQTSVRYKISGHSALFVQAGTVTSTRGRGEPNSFNVIRIDAPDVTVERYIWKSEEKVFTCASSESFRRLPEGWVRCD